MQTISALFSLMSTSKSSILLMRDLVFERNKEGKEILKWTILLCTGVTHWILDVSTQEIGIRFDRLRCRPDIPSNARGRATKEQANQTGILCVKYCVGIVCVSEMCASSELKIFSFSSHGEQNLGISSSWLCVVGPEAAGYCSQCLFEKIYHFFDTACCLVELVVVAVDWSLCFC